MDHNMPKVVDWLLCFLSKLYLLGGKARQRLHRFFQYRATCPVVCVGNLSVGGTGKTPLVMLLARAICQQHVLAIISRGYRSNDEPLMLEKRLKGVAKIYVGKNRKSLAKKAQSASCIILDDGMQNEQLYKDRQVVMLPAVQLWGNGRILPRGRLRESPENLKKADLVVIHHSGAKAQFNEDVEKIRRFTDAPVVGTRFVVKHWRQVDTIAGKEVIACCAIGSPEHFFALLKREGAIIKKTYVFADHASLPEELFIKHPNSLFCCTEKDAIKRPKDRRICWPECETEVLYGQEHWEKFCREIADRGVS